MIINVEDVHAVCGCELLIAREDQHVTTLSKWKQRTGAKKDFETEHSGVFAPPGLRLAHVLTAESGFKFSHSTGL
jgi:hypothetical protein